MKNDVVEKLNFSGWPLPDECLIELGRLSALWANLESFLNVFIAKLSGFDELENPQPFILLVHASFQNRLDMFSALCEQLVPENPHLIKYKETVGILKKAQNGRNKYMHNQLVFNPETESFQMPIGSARGSLKVSVENITIADIRRAVMATDEAMTALLNLNCQSNYPPAWKRRAANQE